MVVVGNLRCNSSTREEVFTHAALLSLLYSYVVSYQVTVPKVDVVAVRGHPVVLGCEFTPVSDAAPGLPSLLVTWQRVEDSQVVHSFYYGQDQLDLQSTAYQNRTALFVSELGRGNASLLIGPVGPGDVGRYLCVVSTTDGTGRAELQLFYGAFYTEPRLSVRVNSSTMTLSYEAEGFPEPEVRWVGERGEDLQHHEDLSIREEGLYHLMSSCVVNSSSLSVTFMLKNHLLKQDLKRPMNFSYAGGKSCAAAVTILTAFAVPCALLCITTLVVCWLYCKKQT